MTVILTGTRISGTKRQFAFEDDVDEINLTNKRIIDLELTPIRSFTNLRELRLYVVKTNSFDISTLSSASLRILSLGGNYLQKLDLSALIFCVKLETLTLTTKQLKSVDLSPLRKCPHFRKFSLYSEEIKNVDLSPFSSCTNLETIGLSTKQIHNIDLSPLSSCAGLKELYLPSYLNSIDLSPLNSCVNLEEINWGYIGNPRILKDSLLSGKVKSLLEEQKKRRESLASRYS